MDYKRLKITIEDGLAIVTLSDPATLNAASLEMGTELHHVMASLSAPDAAARAIVLTGEGRGFCSGANLSAGAGPRRRRSRSGRQAGRRQGAGTHLQPHGHRDPGSADPHRDRRKRRRGRRGLLHRADGRHQSVGAESAYFLQAFRRIGLVPDGGSTYLLPRLIGKARAMEMALLGEKISAAKALEWGLINRVVPDADLMSTAIGIARELANGPKSLGLIRRAMWDSLDAAWLEQLHTERMAQRIAGKTDDFKEGVSAFLQKRPAAFQGH